MLTDLSQILTLVADAIIAATAMTEAPSIITTQSVPATRVLDMFSLEIQSRNTNKQPDNAQIRMAHDLTIRFVSKINPNRAKDDYKASLDREEKVIRALLVQAQIPAVRTLWVSSRRTLTPAREQLISELSFDLETYFHLFPGSP